jgi:antitoxin VapB
VAVYVRDPEVDKLAEALAAIRRQTKTAAVRQALLNDLERERGRPSLVAVGVDYCRALRARGQAQAPAPADKAFLDALYEDR